MAFSVDSRWRKIGVLVGLAVGGVIALSLVACGPSRPASRPAAAEPTPTPVVSATEAPSPTARAMAPQRPTLTVEEHPIALDGEDTPTRFEYSERIDREIREKRAAWRGFQDRTASAIAELERVGYRVVARERASQSPLYDLYRGDRMLLQDVTEFRTSSVSATGSDIAVMATTERGQLSLIRKDSVEPWDEMRSGFIWPVFVGDDLTWLEMETGEGIERFVVVKDGKTVATLPSETMGVDMPAKGLWSWDGKWVAEMRGKVYVDGASLNDSIGASEVFGWRLIDGRPFYFFKKADAVQVSFDGQVLPLTYREVVHYRCCEPAAFNLQGNDRMVWFHALRGNTWHYVEMGVYDGDPPPAVTPGASKRPATTERPTASERPPAATPSGSAMLKRGSVEEARKHTGLDVRLPKYLPTDAKPDGDVAYLSGDSALVSIGFIVGDRTLEIRFARQDVAALESRGEPVDLGWRQAIYVSQVKVPSDETPPVARVGWLEGDAFTSVIGNLPKDELVKVAASLVATAPLGRFDAADLGPGWAEGPVATPIPGNDRVQRLFEWSGPGEASDEGLRQIVYEVERHPDAIAAKAALDEPLPTGYRLLSGPEVGDRSRYYALTQDGMAGVVVEAVRGEVRVRVGVLGLPQSLVKETKAAELAKIVFARTGR